MLNTILAFALGVVVGLIVIFLVTRKREYFASPSSNKIELNCAVKQALKLISYKAGQRWYEARALLFLGIFTSVLCALKLIHLVRIDFMHNDESHGRSTVIKIPGWVKYEKILDDHEWWVEKARTQLKLNGDEGRKNYWYYQTFIAGHNIVKDFMNNYE